MRFFNRPLDLVGRPRALLFIWLCFIGATRAMRERAHLGVDLLVRKSGPSPSALSGNRPGPSSSSPFMGSLAWEGYKLTMLNRERLFGDSGLSYAYVTIAVPVGCLFLTLAMLTNGVEAWRARRDGKLLIFNRDDDTDIHQEL